jgi:hypothetical protein
MSLFRGNSTSLQFTKVTSIPERTLKHCSLNSPSIQLLPEIFNGSSDMVLALHFIPDDPVPIDDMVVSPIVLESIKQQGELGRIESDTE